MTNSTSRNVALSLPDGVNFSDLRLARGPDGVVSFDWGVIERICKANDFDIKIFRDCSEDNVAALIAAWYSEHLARGGERDPTQEDLLAEVAAEDMLGGGISYPPGRA